MDLSALPTRPWPERRAGSRTCTSERTLEGTLEEEGVSLKFGSMDLEMDDMGRKDTWPLGNAVRAQKKRRREAEFEKIDWELLRVLLDLKPQQCLGDTEDTESCEFEGPPMPEGQRSLSSVQPFLSSARVKDCTQKSCTGPNSKRVSLTMDSNPLQTELQVVVDKALTGYDTQEYTSPPKRPRGRIVLPRGTIESWELLDTENDVCHISLLDCNDHTKEWPLRLKRWNNRRSKMYVLEGAGSYLSKYKLKSGDQFRIMVDGAKQLYLQHEKRTCSRG